MLVALAFDHSVHDSSGLTPSLGRKHTLTRVHPDYETANDEHLERLGFLAEGEQQSCEDGKAVVHQQRSLPAGETMEVEGKLGSITLLCAHELLLVPRLHLRCSHHFCDKLFK